MTSTPIAGPRIQKLIDDTQADLEYFRMMRQTARTQFDRERFGVDALACSIRLKALRQALLIVVNPPAVA